MIVLLIQATPAAALKTVGFTSVGIPAVKPSPEVHTPGPRVHMTTEQQVSSVFGK